MRMTNLTMIAGAIALALAGTSAAAAAKPENAGKNKPQHQSAATQQDRDGNDGRDVLDRTIDRVLTEVERELIGDYYQQPENRQGAKPLPPGIAKNLKRGKPLPPGIARTRGDVPQELVSRLNERDGVRPSIVGTDVILEDIATGVLIDILRDVVR